MKIQFKHWKSIHSYVGLALGSILLLIAVTGFFMLEDKYFGLKDQEVTFVPLVAWYQTLPEEKKDYKEREVVTLYTADGKPVEVASDHGAILVAEAEDRWVKAKESVYALAVTKKAFAKTEDPKQKYLHWGKIVDDLHTGKFFGGWLNLLYYTTAVSLVFLTVSGVYLWYKPWAQKRARKAAQAAQAKKKTVAAKTITPVSPQPEAVYSATSNDKPAPAPAD